MQTNVSQPPKRRVSPGEPLNRPCEEIKTQVVAVLKQRPGIDVIRLAMACNLPIVGKHGHAQRLGVHAQALIDQMVKEGAIQLAEPSKVHPDKPRVFLSGQRELKPQHTTYHRSEVKRWFDPSFATATRRAS